MLLKLIFELTITFVIVECVSAKVSWQNSSEKCVDNSTIFCRLELNEERVSPEFIVDDEGKNNGGVFWYESVPIPPIVVATSESLDEGSACKRQLRRYIEELRNGTMWAVQSE